MAMPSEQPSTSPAGADWPDQAADTVVRVIDQVRDRTTGQVLTAARGIVYGFIGVFAAVVALVLFIVGSVRFVDIWLPRGVWAAYLLIGTVFLVAGLLVWRKRALPAPTA